MQQFNKEDPIRWSRSNEYVAVKGMEGIGIEESVLYSEKQPLHEGGQEGSGVAKGAANRLADDPEAVTSYTNKEAIEGADEEEKPMSRL